MEMDLIIFLSVSAQFPLLLILLSLFYVKYVL